MLSFLFFCFNIFVISNIYGLLVIPITLIEFYLFKQMYYYLRKSYRVSSIQVALLNMIISCYFIGFWLAFIITLEIIIARYFKYLLIKLRSIEIDHFSYGNPSRYHTGNLNDLRHVYQTILEIMCELERV